MRIGLTYDLRDQALAAGFGAEQAAEFDRTETIDAIASAIGALGYQSVPIGNLEALMRALLAGERWDIVFNLAEGMWGTSRESQVPALLDAWRIPYVFSDATVLAVTLDKALAKRVVRDQGIATASFEVVRSERDLAGVHLPYPLFVKPIAEGSSKGVSERSVVTSPAALARVCMDLIRRFAQPVIVETYLPGREFTVGLIGTGERAAVLGVLEVVPGSEADAGAYTYDNKARYATRITYRLADTAAAARVGAAALAAWRALGCRDGGRIDFRMDGVGRPCFLEANPLAGLDPEHSDIVILARMLGIGYTDLIGRIIASAAERLHEQGIAPSASGSTGRARTHGKRATLLAHP